MQPVCVHAKTRGSRRIGAPCDNLDLIISGVFDKFNSQSAGGHFRSITILVNCAERSRSGRRPVSKRHGDPRYGIPRHCTRSTTVDPIF